MPISHIRRSKIQTLAAPATVIYNAAGYSHLRGAGSDTIYSNPLFTKALSDRNKRQAHGGAFLFVLHSMPENILYVDRVVIIFNVFV